MKSSSSSPAEERLIVFAKAPRLGKVKTRLSPPLTTEQSLDLHRALVEVTLNRFECFKRPLIDHHLYLSEPLGNDKHLEIPSGWIQQIQEGNHLGERLETAFRRAFDDGIKRVVVLGSDSPTLPFQCVEEAFDDLVRFDAVLGPSLDGGYYLMGCSRFIPEVFKDISWGKSTVLRETAEVLNRVQCSFSYLIDWYDIDTDEDLMRLREEIGFYQREEPGDVPKRITDVLPEETGD